MKLLGRQKKLVRFLVCRDETQWGSEASNESVDAFAHNFLSRSRDLGGIRDNIIP